MSGLGFSLTITQGPQGPKFKVRYFARLSNGTIIEGYDDEGPNRIIGEILFFEPQEEARRYFDNLSEMLMRAFFEAEFERSIEIQLVFDIFSGWQVRAKGLDPDPTHQLDFPSPDHLADYLTNSVDIDAYRTTSLGP